MIRVYTFKIIIQTFAPRTNPQPLDWLSGSITTRLYVRRSDEVVEPIPNNKKNLHFLRRQSVV